MQGTRWYRYQIIEEVQITAARLALNLFYFIAANVCFGPLMYVFVRICPLGIFPQKIPVLQRFDLVAFMSAFVRLCPLTTLR